MTVPPILLVNEASVLRGPITLLDRIGLRVDVGQHTALLGPNGSGKSTLLKLLMRIYYPSVVDGRSGDVQIFGQSEWNVWDLRTQLGFVSSELDHHFLMGRSGRLCAQDVVLTGHFSSELPPAPELVTTAMRREALEALRRMDIADLAHRPVGHLSTGERRRVMLARAMVHHPTALILDEPTSGLDVRAQDQLLQRLEPLAECGTTLILVTHHFEEVLPCIDRTVLMGHGRVVFDGPTRQAMQPNRLSELYGCPLKVERSAAGYWRVQLRQ